MTDEQWKEVQALWKDMFTENLNPSVRTHMVDLAEENDIDLGTCDSDVIMHLVNQAKVQALSSW